MNLESPYTHEIAAIEACLLTATTPITAEQLIKVFDDNLSQIVIEDLVKQLQQKYITSSVELIKTATGYRFRSKVEYQTYINKLYAVKPPKYSRSIMETLAIIAYKQPITRGEIEEIRGVQVNSNIIQILNERGWIEVVGHKQVPGKPELLGTTNALLEDLGIISLQELPPLTIPQDTSNKLILNNGEN